MRPQLPGAIFGLTLAVVAMVQGAPAADGSAEPAAPAAIRYQRGMVVKAQGGGFKNILGTLTVPTDWPDHQSVQVLKQELPPGASISFTTIEGAGRQMLVKIPSLAAGQEGRAVVTFEIQPLPTPPPVDPAALKVPDASSLDRKTHLYLAPSPYIESDDAGVRKMAEEIAGGQTSAWEKVKAIHDWVKKNIKNAPKEGKDRGAALTLRVRVGDSDDKMSLAVALCRAQQIPARLVRIARPGAMDHCYFEFYLADAEGIVISQ